MIRTEGNIFVAILFVTMALLWSCSSMRYVPGDRYLLKNNSVEVFNEKNIYSSQMVSKEALAEFIKQRPNKKALGIGFALGFHNMTDTSKHDKWHHFWGYKVGKPPVIFDSTLMIETSREMQIYLTSRGFLNATVSDSVSYSGRKATVYYKVNQNKPYTISYIDYNIEDSFLKEILLPDTAQSLLKSGNIFDRQVFQNERIRITDKLRNMGFYQFGNPSINYTADSSWNDNTVAIQVNVKQRIENFGPMGKPIYSNHPIYRISRIVVNTDYNPTNSIEQNDKIVYDTLVHNGIEIVYTGELLIKPEILTGAITFSPNSLYEHAEVLKTNYNINDLGFSTTILSVPVARDSSDVTIVTLPSADGEDVSTTEQHLECHIQCTPHKRQSLTGKLETSMTAAYSSLALTFGYQNRNLFRGAENFMVSVRGAYEIMKNQDKRNSYEIGVTSSLTLPRFTPSFGFNRFSQLRQKTTTLQLTYNMQERPDYHRTIMGGTFGYGWTGKNGSRWSINPIDVNLVRVPWVNPDFIDGIENEYLRNSYKSQIIAGLSASYYYGSNPSFKESGYSFRFTTDMNGNLLSLMDNFVTKPGSTGNENYHTLFGVRYAQYARASFDYNARHSFNDYAQLSWRFYAGAAIPYGNSSQVPFERLFFAGGSNSMRGWQIRTLGPGASPYDANVIYPNQLGDMRLEGNLEFRYKVWNGISLATFVDAGNIWMNSKARKSDDELFKFNTFYKQLAMNTGLGFRWDFDFFLVRFDWGLKLRSPGMPEKERWFKEMKLSDTAFHFAIGLPF